MKPLLRPLYRIFLKGLLTLLPISLTLYLIVWIAQVTESAFGLPLQNLFPGIFPGAGLLVGIFVIFAVGLAVNSYMTQQLVEWFDRGLENLPIVRAIYGPIRDVTNLFANQTSATQQRVVMVQINDGAEALGLVTRDTFTDLPVGSVPASSVAVFIPYSYGMGGMTIVVAKSRTREISIPAERAMQLAITGWIKSSK